MTSLKVTLLPSALFLLVPCILPESPLWLIRFDLMKKMSQHRNHNYHKMTMSHMIICLTWSEKAAWRKVARWFSGFEEPTTPLSRRSKRWRQLPGDLIILVIRGHQYYGHHTVIWLCKHNLLSQRGCLQRESNDCKRVHRPLLPPSLCHHLLPLHYPGISV